MSPVLRARTVSHLTCILLMRKLLGLIVFSGALAIGNSAQASRNSALHLPEPGFASQSPEKKQKSGLFPLIFKQNRLSEPDVEIDERMGDAIHIAERAARSRSIKRCWRYVKRALQLANVIDCYPRTRLAKQAAVELPERYGFKQIPVENPFEAPVGAVLVYGGRGAGHVEIRTERGFVSDFSSPDPSQRPLIGVFIKPPQKSEL